MGDRVNIDSKFKMAVGNKSGYYVGGPLDEKEVKYLVIYSCARACKSGSQCRPNECIFGSGKPWGVSILERGV